MTHPDNAGSFNHQTIAVDGMPVHFVEAGQGPAVLLLHGFPYTWFEWRHQIGPLAAAGYRVIAPDLRGFGLTGKPERTENYTLLHCAGDAIGLLRALGVDQAVVAGHDLGAWVAATVARMRPDMVRGLALLSTPVGAREAVRPSLAWAGLEQSKGGKLYHDYFQQPGLAEAELDRDIARALRGIYHSISGDASGAERWRLFIQPGETLLDTMPDPARLPPWLPEAALEEYVRQYSQGGFAPPLAHYRCRNLSWDLTAAWAGQPIKCPALFVGGDADPAFEMIRGQYDALEATYTDLRAKTLLPGIGHGAPEEAPTAVTSALLEFISGLAA